jgi:hypothetical protein
VASRIGGTQSHNAAIAVVAVQKVLVFNVPQECSLYLTCSLLEEKNISYIGKIFWTPDDDEQDMS